jgi:GntR family transcriptional regulator of arabinose operon
MRRGKTTLYQSLVADITAQIETGTHAPGERLPSMSVLSEQYQVSDITVRTALRELVSRGLLESRRGSGFYIKAQRPETVSRTADKLIAMVILTGNSSTHSFFGGVVSSAEAQCRAEGYRMIVATNHDSAEEEAQQIQELADEVAGLIIAPASRGIAYGAYTMLLERKIPFVFIDRYVEKLSVPVIATDNEKGGYLATHHLLQIGRRRIYAVTEWNVTSVQERLRGYRRALQESGIAFDPALVLGQFPVGEHAYLLVKQMLQDKAPTEPFALFALSDAIAQQCYAAIKEAGLRIPEDVAIVGFDDAPYAPYLDPPLSTVRQDLKGMGATAAQLLLDIIRFGDQRRPPSVRLSPELIVRNSSDVQSTFSLAHHLTGNAIRR